MQHPLCLPHARGGVSDAQSLVLLSDIVFPTPVGVFPACLGHGMDINRLPHARGGVSHSFQTRLYARWSSPRPWGCFYGTDHLLRNREVFPTPVGVFPLYPAAELSPAWSSPRTWGCSVREGIIAGIPTVFPTPVGVLASCSLAIRVRSGLPHARGGVSQSRPWEHGNFVSSPRPWGCFLSRGAICFVPLVFPTPVGVFPVRSSALC